MIVTNKAPQLSGTAVLGNGQIEENFDLYKNIGPKGAVVFFYPKDFTFVCPRLLFRSSFQAGPAIG